MAGQECSLSLQVLSWASILGWFLSFPFRLEIPATVQDSRHERIFSNSSGTSASGRLNERQLWRYTFNSDSCRLQVPRRCLGRLLTRKPFSQNDTGAGDDWRRDKH